MTRRKTYQQGSVSLHNGSWTLRYRELDHTSGTWKIKRQVLGKFKNQKDALKAATPIMARINERNNSEPQKLYSEITFKEFLETHWQAYTVSEKHEPTTLDQRASLLRNHLLPYFGEMKLRAVEPSHVAAFFAERQASYSSNTLSALFQLLRLLFDIAEQYDLIDKSPVRSKRHRPKSEKVSKPTLTAAQIRQVIGNLRDEQERLFVLLLAVTGLRVREALALRWQDFNAEGCRLSINHTLYKGELKKPKTKKSIAMVKLHPAIAGLLVAHQKDSCFPSREDYIFCQNDGEPLSYTALLNKLQKAIEQAGIARERGKHGFHILRHSAGTLLYEKSRDLKLVQGTLRHADIAVTSDVYVHLTDQVLSEGSSLLAEEILTNGALLVTQKSELVS